MTGAYTVDATNWRPSFGSDPARIGSVDLLIYPIGLKLYGVRIITTPYGLRVSFPGRPALSGRVERAAIFPEHADWDAFSAIAVEALERAFPGALSPAEAIAA
jgi:hypothetical protein